MLIETCCMDITSEVILTYLTYLTPDWHEMEGDGWHGVGPSDRRIVDSWNRGIVAWNCMVGVGTHTSTAIN